MWRFHCSWLYRALLLLLADLPPALMHGGAVD
jgi:hypothetical protein